MKTKNVSWLAFLLATVIGCSGINLPENPLIVETATPTVRPSPTPTETLTPTPTSTPTPSPTPTPMPGELLADAQQAHRLGDWVSAQRAYERLLVGSAASSESVVTATLGLAQVYMAQESSERAVELLGSFLDVTSNVDARADAQLLLADALKATGAYEAAAGHYAAVTEARPFLTYHTENWRGDVLYATGALTEALTAYERAVDAAETAGQQVGVLEKIGLTQAAANDYAAALEAYDRILAIARIPGYRARIMYQAAETALAFGDVATAYAQMEALITAYPEEPEAYDALVTLVEAGRPVDDRLRGLIDYYAEAYDPAIRAFYRIIVGDPNHDGEPHYYAGLSYLELELHQRALEEFELLIETHPGDPFVPAAWMGRAEALAALGRLEDAVDSYESVPTLYPDSGRAPEALWEAADLLEDAGAFQRAADLWVAGAESYPDHEEAPEARFRAGLLRHRDGDSEGAEVAWRDLIKWYPFDARSQAAWFWLGKTYLGAGRAVSATEALSTAVSLGASDFYGLRAADLLEGRKPFAGQYTQPASCDETALQPAVDAWMADWLDLEPGASVAEMTGELAQDDRWRRGKILLRLGRFDEARAELESLRVATADDPLAQYRLALAYRDVGLYRSSIIAAATVWRLSPAQSLSQMPRFLGCLVYPTYYSEIVEQEASEQDIGPLFVYALLRQESLFEGYATSFAAAHGLMQVIPPTGAYIADALDWPPGYETVDLYRPMVSVRFGVWYLAEQLELLDGNLFAAMAAYNGGPGNALRWWNLAGGDQDLFVELIAFEETWRYVRLIYEHYNAYALLYTDRGDQAGRSDQP